MTESAWLASPATIVFDDSRTPRADDFGDVYFSADDGLAETRHVFLHHNQLAPRFAALDPAEPGEFVIAETGFGTGLNFLAAAQLWLQTAPANWRLVYMSAEKFPLRRDDLAAAHTHWPELRELAKELQAYYPPLLRGHHRLALARGRVQLQLIFDDAHAALQQLLETGYPGWQQTTQRCVDAFFLDGFAPAKNPDMWTALLFQAMARLSKPGTTFATFTSAGEVKRGLAAAGFDVAKVGGHGRKRDMLCGRWSQQTPAQHFVPSPRAQRGSHHKYDALWALQSADDLPARKKSRAVIVGAGLAGAHTAHALASRGWQVTVIDAADRIASAASGNAQGVLYTKLSAAPDGVSRFALTSYLHALQRYRQLISDGILSPKAADFCGVLQLGYDEPTRALHAAVANAFEKAPDIVRHVDTAAAAAIAAIPLQQPALWMEKAGFMVPPLVCRDLLQHPAITLQLSSRVARLGRDDDNWHVFDVDDALLASAEVVVLCNGNDAAALTQTRHLPLKPVRGQVTLLPASNTSQMLRSVICHDGYLPPARDGEHCIGATFDLRRSDTSTDAQGHADNLARMARHVPCLANDVHSLDAASLAGRAALRCTTPDYLPIAGPVADVAQMRQRFAALASNAQALVASPGAWLPGLYVNSGHGSRGLSSTPLCAELVAACIEGTPFPLAPALRMDLHPARFLIRDLKRARDVAYT
jgi:tRNA 5-methylaminomethyl-2-thiouridine biosynthesis bifunctional protein